MVEKIVIERTEENGWPWKGVIGGRTVYGITPTDILESLYYRYLLDIEKFCRIHVDTVEDSISVHALEDREFNARAVVGCAARSHTGQACTGDHQETGCKGIWRR